MILKLDMVAVLTLWFLLLTIALLNLFFVNTQILEYHPQMLQEYLRGGDQTSFMYPRYEVLIIFQIILNVIQ